MKKKILASVLTLFLMTIAFAPFMALAVGGGVPEPYVQGGAINVVDAADPGAAITNIINYVLGFLGLAAVIIILIGGFMWMTSAGSEERVGKAKKVLSAGIIGIVIILLAWVIARFVIEMIITQGPPANPPPNP